jgi:hypothetical protein
MSSPTFLHLGREVGAGVVAEIFIALKDEQWLPSSAPDPLHFGPAPDPDQRIHVSD